MAAVDMALWDLKGKAFGAADPPAARRQAARPHHGYASILFGRDGSETADIAPQLGRRRLLGGQVRLGTDGPVRERSISIWCAAPAKAWADATLLIDAGCVWDARTALRARHAFAEFGIEWLEEPLRQDDIEGYVWLRDRSPVPIAAGRRENAAASRSAR